MRVQQKKFLFTGVLVIVVFLFIELLGYLTFAVVYTKLYSKTIIKHEIRSVLNSSAEFSEIVREAGDVWMGVQVEVLHPYFGFSADPVRNKWISKNGFPSVIMDQTAKKASDKIRVALFGGSFAQEIYHYCREDIVAFFSKINKNVEILNFSIGGYKQPQQLLVLNYLLATGTDFDYIINIDGFNEVALPYWENIAFNVNPFYPRRWNNRVKNRFGQEEVRIMGKIEMIKSIKRSWAFLFNEYKLYRSPTLSMAWKIGNKYFYNKIASNNWFLHEKIERTDSFAVNGPTYNYETNEELYRDLTDFWFRCSLLMKELCEANNIKYYHFLQPNQYVPGSKPISPKERKIAIFEKSPIDISVKAGYPFLRKKGKELVKNGVNFYDCTDIFINNKEILYKDVCCHLNTKGYKIFVKKMGEFIKNSKFK